MNLHPLSAFLVFVALVGSASARAQAEAPTPPADSPLGGQGSASVPPAPGEAGPGRGGQSPPPQDPSCVNSTWEYGADRRQATSSLSAGVVSLSGASQGHDVEIDLKNISEVWVEEVNGVPLVTMNPSGVFLRSAGTGRRKSFQDEGFEEFSIPFGSRNMAECYAAALRGAIAGARRTEATGGRSGPGPGPSGEPTRVPAPAGAPDVEGWSRWEPIPDTRQNCIEYQVRAVEAAPDGKSVYEYRFRNACDALVILRCNIVDLDRIIRKDLTVEMTPNAIAQKPAGKIVASGPPSFERLESETRENPVYRLKPRRGSP